MGDWSAPVADAGEVQWRRGPLIGATAHRVPDLPEDYVAPIWQVVTSPPLAHCATCCCHQAANSTTDR